MINKTLTANIPKQPRPETWNKSNYWVINKISGPCLPYLFTCVSLYDGSQISFTPLSLFCAVQFCPLKNRVWGSIWTVCELNKNLIFARTAKKETVATVELCHVGTRTECINKSLQILSQTAQKSGGSWGKACLLQPACNHFHRDGGAQCHAHGHKDEASSTGSNHRENL